MQGAAAGLRLAAAVPRSTSNTLAAGHTMTRENAAGSADNTAGGASNAAGGQQPGSGSKLDTPWLAAATPLLHVAVTKHDLTLVHLLLGPGGAYASDLDAGSLTALHVAVKESFAAAVEALVAAGADVGAKDPSTGNTALHMAASSGDAPCMRALLLSRSLEDATAAATAATAEAGSSSPRLQQQQHTAHHVAPVSGIEDSNIEGLTPLEVAITKLWATVAAAPAPAAAPKGQPPPPTADPLAGVVEAEAAAAANSLLNSVGGASVTSPLTSPRITADESAGAPPAAEKAEKKKSFFARMRGTKDSAGGASTGGASVTPQFPNVVALLIQHSGADTNKRMPPVAAAPRQLHGLLPLHIGVTLKSEVMVQLLLGAGGAAPNATAADGTTPLHAAAMVGYAPAALSLVAAGADTGAVAPGSGETPLHIAAAKGDIQVMLSLLGAAPKEGEEEQSAGATAARSARSTGSMGGAVRSGTAGSTGAAAAKWKVAGAAAITAAALTPGPNAYSQPSHAGRPFVPGAHTEDRHGMTPLEVALGKLWAQVVASNPQLAMQASVLYGSAPAEKTKKSSSSKGGAPPTDDQAVTGASFPDPLSTPPQSKSASDQAAFAAQLQQYGAVVAALVQHSGADVNRRLPPAPTLEVHIQGLLPLHLAVRVRSVQLLRLLLDRSVGARPDGTAIDGTTPLHAACAVGFAAGAVEF